MLRNYETWDKKVYSDLRLDSTSIRLVEILSRSDAIHIELSKKPLEEIETHMKPCRTSGTTHASKDDPGEWNRCPGQSQPL